MYSTRLLFVCQFSTDHRAWSQLKRWKVMTAELEELGKSIFVNEVHTERRQTSRSLNVFFGESITETSLKPRSLHPVASCNAGAWDVAPASQHWGGLFLWDMIWYYVRRKLPHRSKSHELWIHAIRNVLDEHVMYCLLWKLPYVLLLFWLSLYKFIKHIMIYHDINLNKMTQYSKPV